MEFFQSYFFANNITIFSMSYESSLTYIKTDKMKLALYPVYKNIWLKKQLHIKNNIIYLSDDKNGNTVDISKFMDINQSKYIKIKNKKNIYSFIVGSYTFMAPAFSYLLLQLKLKHVENFDIYNFDYNGINEDFMYGILEEATTYNFISTFKTDEKKKNNWIPISLRSLSIEIQIEIFSHFISRSNLVITGDTGVGKTSQIPKLFWWYNLLFDGYTAFKDPVFNPIFNSILDSRKSTTLSLPRKILITSLAKTFVESLGYTSIDNSPATCSFKGVLSTPFYNTNKNTSITYVINQLALTKLDSTNTFIIDEIHEHEIICDINITVILKKFRYKIRNLVLMSATIKNDRKVILEYFEKNITFVNISSKTLYPIIEEKISTRFKKSENEINYISLIEYLEQKNIFILNTSIIIFKATIIEVNVLEKYLSANLKNIKNINILKAYSTIKALQAKIFEQTSKNKKKTIIIGTPILESSITVPNAIAVIDDCRFNQIHFRTSWIEIITDEMQIQRKGRIGRTQKGYYFYLHDGVEKKYQKIDHNYLFYHVFYMYKYKLKPDEFFIKSDNWIERINKTKNYLKFKKIDYTSEKVFEILSYPLYIIEYINVYLKLIEEKKYKLLEIFIDYNTSKISKLLPEELKQEILRCTYIRLIFKLVNATLHKYVLQFENEFEDVKNNFLRTKLKKTDKQLFFIGSNLYLAK